MAQDYFKPSGSTRASTPFAGNANARLAPVIGIVKDNIDPIRAGRLQVYIADNSGLDPDDKKNWVTVSFLSPFYGLVRPTSSETGYGSYKTNSSSYGYWSSPPDIGTRVICIFVNGDMNYGFYIGAIPEPEALTMVPAIGATENIIANEGEAQSYGGAVRLPVTNINMNNPGVANTDKYLKEPKPVHTYTAMIMAQQGIIRDPIRGPISSSSQRETPSRVGWGVSTPGRPIYSGGFDDNTVAGNLDDSKNQQLRVLARRGGHSIVMDDGDVIGRDQLIRIRTALGHQILMSDDGQTLMLLHSNGQSYIELGKEGTVDVYSTNSINLRTQGDLNLHADNNINIHAAKNLNIQAEQIHTVADKDYLQRIGQNYKVHTLGQMTTKVDEQMSFESGGESSFVSKDITYINGSKINLNTGSASTKPQEVKPLPIMVHTDTLHDKVKGFVAAPGKLLSITSRAPAHCPWANAGQGVDVKVDLSAEGNLPSPPAAGVADANQAGLNSVTNAVSVSTAATMPVTSPVSAAMDKNVTSATLGAIANDVATGPLAAAVQQGAGIAQTAAGKVAVVGSFGETVKNLETSGFVKPGASTLVDSLVASGANVQSALSSNLFTGKPGGENLVRLANNTAAQAISQVANLSAAQKQLQSLGTLSGKEAPQQIAGIVMSGAKLGIDSTISAVKGFAGSVSSAYAPIGAAAGAISSTLGAANAVAGTVLKTIGQGAYAAGLSQTMTGGLGGIAKALNTMSKVQGVASLLDSTKGVSASAFAAIVKSFVPLKPGVPQNLAALAMTAANAADKLAAGASVGSVASSVGASLLSQAKVSGTVATAAMTTIGALAGTTNNAPNALGALAASTVGAMAAQGKAPPILAAAAAGAAGALTSSVVGSGLSAVSSLAGSGAILNSASGVMGSLSNAANATGGIASAASGLASGISNLPGGQKVVSSVVNGAMGAINSVPGAAPIASLIKDASSAMMNGMPNPAGFLTNSLKSALMSGLPPGAAAQLNSAIAALGSGGAVPIKLPTVGLNTTDRGGITSQISALLGDPGIPKPNLLGEVSEQAKSDLQKQMEESDNNANIARELMAWNNRIDDARKAYNKAAQSYPAGAPEIAAAKKAWFDLTEDPAYIALKERANKALG